MGYPSPPPPLKKLNKKYSPDNFNSKNEGESKTSSCNGSGNIWEAKYPPLGGDRGHIYIEVVGDFLIN